MLIHVVCLFLWCVSLCSGQISHWLNTTEDDSYANYKTENKSSWWAAANTVCTRSGGHLFVPLKQSSLDDLTNLLDENKVYWVGGFQYSSLIWTDDNTRYYTRVGYISPDDAENAPRVTPDNSAFTCHLTCGNSNGLFGLKGYHCYCLGFLSNQLTLNIVRETRATEIRCPGDYNDLCGDDTTVTVYRRDETNVDISPSARCGYVEKNSGTNNNKDYLLLHLTEDCEKTKKFSACNNTAGFPFSKCSGNICVANGVSTWEEARSDCRLVKVTEANKKNLQTVMEFSSYWVGLMRVTERRWINGIPMELNITREDMSRQCLAARHVGGTLSMEWYNCSEKYPAVCQSSAVTNPGTDLVTTPVYVTAGAVGVVAVTVVCGIFVFITLKRKKMYCFKMKTRYNRHMGHFPGDLSESSTRGGQDKTPSDKGPCSLNDGDYCVIDDLESSRLYHHTTAAPGGHGEYDTTRQVQRARRDGSTYNHICRGLNLDAADLDEGQYHLLRRGRSPGQISPSTGLYHHVGPGVAVDEDQYDALRHGRSPGQISSSTGQYHHAGLGVAVAGED